MKIHSVAKRLQLCSLVVLSALTCQFATAFEHTSGTSLSLMGGKYYPAKNRLLDDSSFASVGIIHDYSNAWGVEFNYLLGEPKIMGTQDEIEMQALRLDALYHFSRSRFQPYMLLGVGGFQFELDDGTSSDDSVGQFGLGAKFYLSSWFALRADARVQHGFDSGENDNLASAGVVLRFGGSSKPKPTPTPTPTPVPAVDTDQDGVADVLDLCPNSRAGVAVNSKGCMLDGDGDGVADADDKCPDTEEGARVKADGCYMVLKEDVSVQLEVKFATGSDKVISDSYDEINKLAIFLKEYPKTKVVIEGHSDSSGPAEFNRQLSQRRAAAVAKILVEQFIIDANRVTAIGYGEDRPLVPNDTPANRAKNRRVTAVVSAEVERVIK